jgi:excisionase family DNA binding protein
MQQFCTIRQTQEILNISRPILYRHIKSGEIPAVHVGGRALIPADYFEHLRNQAGNKAKQPAKAQ